MPQSTILYTEKGTGIKAETVPKSQKI